MKHIKRQKTVTLCKHVPKNRKGTKGVKLWAFSYMDLEILFNVSKRSLLNHIKKGLLDPGDLESIVQYFLERTLSHKNEPKSIE